MKKEKEKAKVRKHLVQAVLKGLGLSRLVKDAEKTEKFKKRFEEVNAEIDKKLKKRKVREN